MKYHHMIIINTLLVSMLIAVTFTGYSQSAFLSPADLGKTSITMNIPAKPSDSELR